MQDRNLDGYAPCRRDKSRTTTGRCFDNRLNRIRRIGAFDRHRVLYEIESAFDFLARIPASRLNEARDFAFEPIKLHVDTAELFTHHTW